MCLCGYIKLNKARVLRTVLRLFYGSLSLSSQNFCLVVKFGLQLQD